MIPFPRPKVYVLYDFDGEPLRVFDYPATGAVEVVEQDYVVDWDDFEECLF